MAISWQIFNRVPNAGIIAASTKDLPLHWSITPLQEKSARREGWQTEDFIPHSVIADLILNGEEVVSKKGKPYRRFWSGFGLRFGEASGGLLAIDVDGQSAQPILAAMSGGNVPTTVSWSSGKLGRYQLAFQIPENLRANLREFTRSVITEWHGLETLKDENGKPIELLEFRYNYSQSALPPSLHPTTGSYHWINSPTETAVAVAPDWLCGILLQLTDKEHQLKKAKLEARLQREKIIKKSVEHRKTLGIVGSVDLVDCFAQSVARLSPEEIFNWSGHKFKYRGHEWFGCCPQHQSQSGASFTVRPDTLDWHCFGCNAGGGVGEYRHFVNGCKGTPRGKDFFEITKQLATQAGIELPKLQTKDTPIALQTDQTQTKKQPTSQKKGFSESYQEKVEDGQSQRQKQYIRPIKELPKLGFHVIRRSQDELLQRFNALESKRGREWLKLRQFTPDVTIDSQYFDYAFKPGESLAIKSGLGTGKSYFTNAKWLANPDEGAVLGGYRNCLNEQFCANGEKLNGRPWYQIQSDLKNTQDITLISDLQSRIAGSVDSWIYFAPHHFHEKKTIFDEIESVAKHLNQSDTAVSFHRDVIKQRVSDALTNSTANLIADGNLRDFTVEYLEKLSGGRKFTKILNKYTGNRGSIYLYNGSCRKRKATEEDVKLRLANSVGEWISFDYKADDYSKMHRSMMDLPIDIPLIVLADSQKKCEAWDREFTQLGRKVFRLDSTSSGSDLGKAFLRDSRNFILTEKLDTVILSPSAESGVSIELADELKRQLPGYFKYEFSYFFGISTTDTQLQFLGRNRDPYSTRFCYVQSHSIGSTKQITESHNSNDVFTTWIETIKDCASLSLEGIEEGEILKLALEKIKEQLLNPHIQYESKLMLKESFERTYPRLCLEYALREAGWEVILVESREDDIFDLKVIQEEIALEKATAIFKAEDITPSEADKLAPKLNKSQEERHQITKARLLGRLPGIQGKVVMEEKKVSSPEQLQRIDQSELEKVVSIGNVPYEEWKASPTPIPEKGIEVKVQKPAFDPEFVEKVMDKDRHFISRVEAQFLLRNPEICKLIQQHKWHKRLDLITDPDKVSFGGLPVARYRSKWLEIHTLIENGINFFLDPSNSWHDESPEAIAFWEQGKVPRVARNIGVSHEDDPCRYIGKVLQKYGLRTQEKRKQKPDGSRYREYSIKPIDSLSQAVYECVEQRINSQVIDFIFDWKKIIKNSTFSEPESFDTTELQHVHMAPDNLIKIREDVDVKLEVKASVVVHNTSSRDESQGGGRQVQEADSRTDLERLVDALEVVGSFEEFALVIEGFEASQEQVENAIAFASSQPRRQQLNQWLETLSETSKEEKRQVKLAKLLDEAVRHGWDTVKAFLSRLDLSERWVSVMKLEEIDEARSRELLNLNPNFYTWLGSTS